MLCSGLLQASYLAVAMTNMVLKEVYSFPGRTYKNSSKFQYGADCIEIYPVNFSTMQISLQFTG
jgi:hypothetical protein